MKIFHFIAALYTKILALVAKVSETTENHVARKKQLIQEYKIFSANAHAHSIAVYVHKRRH